MGLASPGSTNNPHPDTAGVASLGPSVGGMIVAEYRVCPSHEFAGHLWNYENQHGSLIGQADVNGDRTVEYDYTDYGLTMERPILIDGRTGNISGLAHDGMLNITSVTFTNGLPSATVLGAEVRVARPGAASDRLLFATVAGTAGGTTIVFPDAGAAIYNAINSTGYGLTVLPFYDNFWGGVWSGASYSSGTGLTTFTGNFGTPVGGGALGDSVKPGMVVVPDLHRAVPLHIEGVNINLLGSDTLTVKGDATGLGGSGTRFRIHQHAPYKYDLTDEVKRNNPCDLGARYLWSSYRQIPWTWSRAGEDPYLAWNRVYLPEIGRWTSADALATPWGNLADYVANSPIARADANGLAQRAVVVSQSAALDRCGAFSSSQQVRLSAPAGPFGGYLVRSCTRERLQWTCDSPAEKTSGAESRIGGGAMVYISNVARVRAGETVPVGPAADSLNESGIERPDARGELHLSCNVFYVDKKKALTQEQEEDFFDSKGLSSFGFLGVRLPVAYRIASSRSDLLKPSDFGGGDWTPQTLYSITMGWNCCCNRDKGELRAGGSFQGRDKDPRELDRHLIRNRGVTRVVKQ